MTKIIQANCETGEVVERDMTVEEKNVYESMLSDVEQFEQTASDAAANKAAALVKLQALGLTEDEVKALLG